MKKRTEGVAIGRLCVLLCSISILWLAGCQPIQPAAVTPAAQLASALKSAGASTEQTASTSPTPVPPLTDLAVAQMLFAERPLPLGELEATFRQQLADGHFQDYTRQDLDVNGDGQPEILISGHISFWYLYFAILGYTAQGWQEWLYTTADTKYCGDVRPTVTTGQITVDFLTCTGGTGVLDLAWEQRWVQCGRDHCAVVWSAPLLWTERLVAWQTARTYEVATVEHPDPNTIRLTTQRFGVSIYPYSDTPLHQPGTAQRSQGPTTVDRYDWDGQHYTWQSREELTPGLTIQDQFDLMTQETYDLVWQQLYKDFEKPDGQMDGEGLERALTDFWQLPPADATSGWQAPHRRLAAAAHTGTPQTLGEWVAGLVGTDELFVCQLSLHYYTNEQLTLVVQQAVPCIRNFSRLAWADLTGDRQAELLLLTIPPAGEADTNVETSAGMQRLHVYTVGDQLTELAVVDGYVNGPDGEGIRWRAGDGAGAQPEVWAGLPLAPLTDPIGWPDRTRRFQVYRWDADQQKLVAAEVQNETGTERASAPTCVAPAALAAIVTSQTTTTPTALITALTALTGSSRPLFDVQAIAVEDSQAVGIPMVIGTWGESWVFRLGGFFAWRRADGQWSLQSFCLGDEKLVAARMASAKATAELAIIWNPCDNNSMGRCHQVRRYHYDRQGWQEQWRAIPGKDGWPYSHAEAHFVDTGIDTIRIKSSSWAPQADPQYPQDAKSQIFAEANPNPHRWFTDTWQYQGDHYAFVQREVQPSAYNTWVEFIYALKNGGDATVWVTKPQVVAQAQQAGVATLPERSLFCLDDWQTGYITGPIKIGSCDAAITVFFVEVAGQYLIDRITPE